MFATCAVDAVCRAPTAAGRGLHHTREKRHAAAHPDVGRRESYCGGYRCSGSGGACAAFSRFWEVSSSWRPDQASPMPGGSLGTPSRSPSRWRSRAAGSIRGSQAARRWARPTPAATSPRNGAGGTEAASRPSSSTTRPAWRSSWSTSQANVAMSGSTIGTPPAAATQSSSSSRSCARPLPSSPCASRSPSSSSVGGSTRH